MQVIELPEAAKMLQVHPNTIRNLIKTGEIPHFRLGQAIRFDADKLKAWIEAKTTSAQAMALNTPRKKPQPKTESTSTSTSPRRGPGRPRKNKPEESSNEPVKIAEKA
jgi:excisionase family DNA binding protein